MSSSVRSSPFHCAQIVSEFSYLLEQKIGKEPLHVAHFTPAIWLAFDKATVVNQNQRTFNWYVWNRCVEIVQSQKKTKYTLSLNGGFIPERPPSPITANNLTDRMIMACGHILTTPNDLSNIDCVAEVDKEAELVDSLLSADGDDAEFEEDREVELAHLDENWFPIMKYFRNQNIEKPLDVGGFDPAHFDQYLAFIQSEKSSEVQQEWTAYYNFLVKLEEEAKDEGLHVDVTTSKLLKSFEQALPDEVKNLEATESADRSELNSLLDGLLLDLVSESIDSLPTRALPAKARAERQRDELVTKTIDTWLADLVNEAIDSLPARALTTYARMEKQVSDLLQL